MAAPSQIPTTSRAPPPPAGYTLGGPGYMPPQYPHSYPHRPAYRNSYTTGPWSYQSGGHLIPHPAPPPSANQPGYYYQPSASSNSAIPPIPSMPAGPQVPAEPRIAPSLQNPSGPPAIPGPGYNYPTAPMYRGRSHANLQWQPSYTGPRELASPVQIHYYQFPPPKPQVSPQAQPVTQPPAPPQPPTTL